MRLRQVAFLITLGVLLLLGFAVTFAISLDAIERSPVNIQLFHWINSHNNPWLDNFFLYFRFLGSGWALMPLILLIILRRRQLFVPLVIGVILETLIVVACKEYFDQPRPVTVLGPQNVHLLLPYLQLSFPSGDAALAFVIAGILMFRAKISIKIAALLYAFLVAYERIYLGVHFPLDVIVGGLIGVISAMIALRFVRENVPHMKLVGKDHQTYGEEEEAIAA